MSPKIGRQRIMANGVPKRSSPAATRASTKIALSLGARAFDKRNP
jgi:hypothetical protein